jgi:hypothetical protein
MHRGILVAASAAVIVMTSIADAEAGSRSGTFVGPRGGVTTWQRQTTCGGGTCTRSGSITGPAGNTWSREGSVTRTGPGSWQSNATVTGPNGGTYRRQGGGTCAGATCAYGGTVTGPYGGTGTYSGTVTRY